jgi:hypothetical protein
MTSQHSTTHPTTRLGWQSVADISQSPSPLTTSRTTKGQGTGVSYTLAVLTDTGHHDLYTGHECFHEAVGFASGDLVRFVVKASNFFGSSDYSAGSEPFVVPTMADDDAEVDERPHCPMFMAGLCFRGAACQFSHGTGLQDADDVAAALMAAAYIDNPEMQLAAAMAASMADFTKPTFDQTNLPAYKREYHAKLTALREKNAVGKGSCAFSVVRQELFKSSFFEVSRRKSSELKQVYRSFSDSILELPPFIGLHNWWMEASI